MAQSISFTVGALLTGRSSTKHAINPQLAHRICQVTCKSYHVARSKKPSSRYPKAQPSTNGHTEVDAPHGLDKNQGERKELKLYHIWNSRMLRVCRSSVRFCGDRGRSDMISTFCSVGAASGKVESLDTKTGFSCVSRRRGFCGPKSLLQ